MSGFSVEPDLVAAHAEAVAELAMRVQGAAAAGEATQAMDGEAYGLIGRVFAQQAQAAVAGAIGGLTSTAGAGQAMAAGLAASAESYRHVERTNAGLLGGAG